MSDPVASLNGHRTRSVRISVPPVGPWFYEAELVDKVELSKLAGKVTLKIGDLELVGTVAPSSSGTFGEATAVRVVAGAGQWGKLLSAKGYHNDRGVKAHTIVGDAAREAGETLGTLKPVNERVGDDYVRRAGPASQTLEDALGGLPWWVDYAGVTHGGERPTAKAGTYELLEYDPRSRMATLAMDDLTAVGVGTVLEQRLDAPQTVRELDVTIAEGAMRVRAWCGDDARALARLPALLEAFIKRATGGKLWGKYRYRLVTMAVDGRTNLQAVSKAVGLPDMLLIHMTPGVSGAHSELAPAAEVYVEFVAGDPADPIVTGFVGKDGSGFVPVKTTIKADETFIDASGRVTVGASSPAGVPDAARKGDTVKVLLPPAVFSGVIGVVPANGVLTFPSMYALGTIETGSSKVGVAT